MISIQMEASVMNVVQSPRTSLGALVDSREADRELLGCGDIADTKGRRDHCDSCVGLGLWVMAINTDHVMRVDQGMGLTPAGSRKGPGFH